MFNWTFQNFANFSPSEYCWSSSALEKLSGDKLAFTTENHRNTNKDTKELVIQISPASSSGCRRDGRVCLRRRKHCLSDKQHRQCAPS